MVSAVDLNIAVVFVVAPAVGHVFVVEVVDGCVAPAATIACP